MQKQKRGATSDLVDGRWVEFSAAVLRALPRNIDPGTALKWASNGKDLARVLRSALCSPGDSSLDFTIHVDRSVSTCPEWAKELMHPELELIGPVEYNPQDTVELWLHDDQKNGFTTGHNIYQHLKATDALGSCLGLADLLAIQQKGITVFRELFKGKAVFAWKSVARYRDGYLSVPYLYGFDDEVVLLWNWLGRDWDSGNPALRFRKS